MLRPSSCASFSPERLHFYFALQTGLLHKIWKTLPLGKAGKPSVVETYLDDYIVVQGAQVPMRIKGTQDGNSLLELKFIYVKFADVVEESAFAKP
jgi:hypothetical protein